MNNDDDIFFIPFEDASGSPEVITISDLEKLRVAAFDRWTWDTGSDKDKATFEKLDKIIKNLNNPIIDAGLFYCPYIPTIINDVDDTD